MTSVSAGHIILTPTQPVGSGRPQLESNPTPPHLGVVPLYRLSYRAPLGEDWDKGYISRTPEVTVFTRELINLSYYTERHQGKKKTQHKTDIHVNNLRFA